VVWRSRQADYQRSIRHACGLVAWQESQRILLELPHVRLGDLRPRMLPIQCWLWLAAQTPDLQEKSTAFEPRSDSTPRTSLRLSRAWCFTSRGPRAG